jgi:hypothetical protein
VAKKRKPVKENLDTPAKRIERRIIDHCFIDIKSNDTDIYHMRDTLNTCLNKFKEPVSIGILGLKWSS